MSPAEEGQVGPGVKLLPHQASFVETCMNSTGKRVVLLRGEVGLGKSRALAALMSRWQRERRDARMLMLSPAALRVQLVEMLRDEGVPTLLVDRYQFRERLDSEAGEELWPHGIVVVMSLDFAKQTDVLDSLAETHWDLMIVDEAHLIRGARAEAVRRISEVTARVVLATGVEFLIEDVLPGVESTTVEWRRDRIVNTDGRRAKAFSRPILHEVAYALSVGELSLLKTVEDLSQGWQPGKPAAEWAATSLVRRVRSSPVALEESLRRIVEGLRSADPPDISLDNAEDELPERDADATADWVAHTNASVLAMRALQELEVVDRDSKLAALGNLLAQLSDSGTPRRHVCVLTEYVSTLHYLAAGIEDIGLACQLLHGGVAPEERQNVLSSFVGRGGILAATTAVMQGFELPVTTDLVLYDIPGSRVAQQIVLGRFDRFGRQDLLHVHVLTPSNVVGAPALQSLALLREELRGSAD